MKTITIEINSVEIETGLTCPKCGGKTFGRDVMLDADGNVLVLLNSVRCYTPGCGWWRGEWPTNKPAGVTDDLKIAQLLRQRAELIAALGKISSIVSAGVISRSEPGKLQWSAFDEIKKILAGVKGVQL